MRIDSAQIMLGSQHQFARQITSKEELVVGTAQPDENWSKDNLHHGLIYKRNQHTAHSLSTMATQATAIARTAGQLSNNQPLLPENIAATQDTSAGKTTPSGDQPLNDIEPRFQVLIRMIEIITGKKFQLQQQQITQQDIHNRDNTRQKTTRQHNQNWGLSYHAEKTIRETEFTALDAQGNIKTTDGREIAFKLELNMSREFIQHEQIDITAGAARLQDPLVINLNGNAAQLLTNQFSFDLNTDGTNETIFQLSPDSGLLALDRNNDGEINNGSELFGAMTGDGFAELAQYDDDKNGFIDEADNIFSKLKLWLHTAQGESQLLGLLQANVGAIYLGHITTPFDLRDQQNNLQGRIRDSGIFLAETGTVGTVQQLDLVI